MPRWTKEARQKQAETIRKTKPWEKATGPKTAAGKKRSAQNAIKHGMFSREAHDMARALRDSARMVAMLHHLDEVKRLHGLLSSLPDFDAHTNELNKLNKKDGEQ